MNKYLKQNGIFKPLSRHDKYEVSLIDNIYLNIKYNNITFIDTVLKNYNLDIDVIEIDYNNLSITLYPTNEKINFMI